VPVGTCRVLLCFFIVLPYNFLQNDVFAVNFLFLALQRPAEKKFLELFQTIFSARLFSLTMVTGFQEIWKPKENERKIQP
jgi:hypothetical protein